MGVSGLEPETLRTRPTALTAVKAGGCEPYAPPDFAFGEADGGRVLLPKNPKGFFEDPRSCGEIGILDISRNQRFRKYRD